MKIFIRGGVWSNVEDQVLIAAYMKYGNNQWTRIASLLPRKSAAQVKARWEEYLDPTLRKTPWTTSENNRLLHLARLMPTQWRTIAQYFGRSTYQCVEHYRELLSLATGTNHVDDNETALDHQMMPFFETIEATPDSVELEDDEREMLEEARARLSNTQGKKARRKARTRQLDVLRKTARMRKKKELEAAGLVLEEKKVWAQEENEIEPIRTHKAVVGPFDAKSDEKGNGSIVSRMRNKQKRVKETNESLDALKKELKVEEKKIMNQTDKTKKALLISKQSIPDNELRNIEKQRHHDEDYLFHRSDLSLLGMNHKKEFLEDVIQEEEEKEKEYTTPPYQKNLPRPIPLNSEYLTDESNRDPNSCAEELIRQEAFRLAFFDARSHSDTKKALTTLVLPVSSALEIQFANIDNINERAFLEAEVRIKEEMESLNEIDENEFVNAWSETHLTSDDDISEPLKHLRKNIAQTKAKSEKTAIKALEESRILYSEINDIIKENHDLCINKMLFKEVADKEMQTLTVRIDDHKRRISELENKRISLDLEYERLIEQKKMEKRLTRKSKK